MTADVVIVDSGGANLASLQHALTRLGASSTISQAPTDIANARRVLLPGVGSAGSAMARIVAAGLDRLLPTLRQPLLGICLGMQLLFDASDEGDVRCLGLLPGRVGRLAATPGQPVPHMGWNTVQRLRDDPLLEGIAADERVYFVHSYAARVNGDTIASCDYSGGFAAVVGRANFRGVQFHPERSGPVGARLLANFLRL